MVKYENKKNFKVAKVVSVDERAKTFMLEYDDGTTTVASSSTFKRWWKKIEVEDEQLVAEEVATIKKTEDVEAPVISNAIVADFEKSEAEEAAKVASASTPLDYFDALAQGIGMPYYTLAAYPMERYYKYDGGKVKAKINFCKNGDFTLWLKSKDLGESVDNKLASKLDAIERWNCNRRLVVKVKGDMDEFKKNFENILTLIINSLKEEQ